MRRLEEGNLAKHTSRPRTLFTETRLLKLKNSQESCWYVWYADEKYLKDSETLYFNECLVHFSTGLSFYTFLLYGTRHQSGARTVSCLWSISEGKFSKFSKQWLLGLIKLLSYKILWTNPHVSGWGSFLWSKIFLNVDHKSYKQKMGYLHSILHNTGHVLYVSTTIRSTHQKPRLKATGFLFWVCFWEKRFTAHCKLTTPLQVPGPLI